ncbi:cytidylyltransferase domain-containing protein [Candidatus Protochlamydia phocaeensis]|uniref:cytidylyltransferase domain-containing protein n=1 Tax=Candidatus Protochlamydia phocaeensis TaxID=1414722 RepID=UPI000837A993|nr:glycosyltransferase family protein [Candidatus Protochlamydia phocaeensis]
MTEEKKIKILVQARMGSTRLPGKVMKEVLGRPLLDFQIERLQQARLPHGIEILTTTESSDEPIVAFCQKKGLAYFRGSEEDVLDRYYQAAKEGKLDVIVRVTADCPLIDPDILDHIIAVYLAAFPTYDYVSNGLERTYPRGLDVEVFSFAALEKSYREAKEPEEREHVTPYIYRHPELFHLKNISHSPALDHYRWTVDTPEDFELIQLILDRLYPLNPRFRLQDILALLDRHPDWNKINAHIEQKKLSPLNKKA